MLSKFVTSNTASTSGTLPSNTVTNPKEDLKGITTRSGVAYKGPTIPITSSPKVVEREPEVTKDTMPPTNNGSTEDVQPPVVPVVHHESISEPVNAPVSASMPNQKASIPFPSRRNDERRREKANDQIEKFYEIFRDLSFEISFTDALMLMPKFASTLKTLIGNKEKLSEMARTPLNENCSAVILNKLPKKLGDPGRFLIPCEFSGINTCNALADLGASINLMPYSVWKNLSLPELTPTCMTLELADRSISEPIGIAEDVYVTVGKFQFPADFVVVDFEPDPPSTLLLGRGFLKTSRALIDVYEGEITLRVGRERPPITLNLGDDKLPVIIAKDLKNEEKAALIEVLKSHKRAIAWKLSDIKGINPEFCTHKILMEEDYEPRFSFKAGPWVSPMHCVPKKGGMTVVKNDENDLIPTRLVTGWRVASNRTLNEVPGKDHFPLPFMDQMLERLAGNQLYCFLDGFLGYFQIPIEPEGPEKAPNKIPFTCPYGTFVYRRMLLGYAMHRHVHDV
ncbi:reverse transcriptase domain-containing protein [Tanacetum coccineum]|uniref:Reverse transcriptase domain-containing protein n=1 Tax=Tanacetum coccineum TaxID=301880 RepID=A0ABQ5D823_9ASTR